MKTAIARPTLALVTASLALVVAVAALVVTVGTPTGPTVVACAPIRVAPAEGTTTATSMAVAVAAVRLAAPGREVTLLPLNRMREADVAVEGRGPGAYYVPTPMVLRVDDHALIPHSDVLALPAMLDGHLPACGGGK